MTQTIELKDYFPNSSFYVKTKAGERKLIDKLNKEDIVESIRFGNFGKYLKMKETLKIDENWVYISELLRTDGHITKDMREVKLTNKNLVILEKFEKFCKSLGISYIRKDREDSYYRFRVFNRVLAKILIEVFGIKQGNKSLDTKLPEWMKELHPYFTCYLLGGAFDGDGGLQFSKTTRRLRYSTGSAEYAKGLQEMLKKIGITSTLFRDPRKNKNVYYVQVSKKKDLTRFYKKVKFFHDLKSRKLKDIVESYKNFSIEEIETEIKSILEKSKSIHISELSRKLRRSTSTISAQVRKLEEMGKLKTKKIGNKKMIYLTKEFRS